jgi:hypothetical protein
LGLISVVHGTSSYALQPDLAGGWEV